MTKKQQATDTSSTAAQLAAAKRTAFGIDDLTSGMTPAEAAITAMSYRDAQARAAAGIGADPQAARALLDQAEQTGDELLARAVGNAALTAGMQDVADQYLANRPAKRAAVDKLAQLRTDAQAPAQ